MDWLTAFLIAFVSAGATGTAVYLNARAARQPPLRRQVHYTYAGKWELPPPGLNLNLYRKTKGLLDTLEQERNDARRERDAALEKLTESGDEIERLEHKLGAARTILKEWTHPGMEFGRESPRQERQRIVSIL